MKRYSTLLFSIEEQGLENRKLRKLFGKGRRRKMKSKGFKISQKFQEILKSCKCLNASQGLAFIDSWCLVKKIIRRVITFRKTWKPLEELHLLIFIQNLSLVTDYQILVINYTKLLWKDVTLHTWKNYISCNRLHHFEINWNVANSIESFWNQTLTLVIDYMKLVIDYERVKTLVT